MNGTGMDMPKKVADNKNVGGKRPQSVSAGKGGPTIKSNRTSPLRGGKK